MGQGRTVPKGRQTKRIYGLKLLTRQEYAKKHHISPSTVLKWIVRRRCWGFKGRKAKWQIYDIPQWTIPRFQVED